MPETPRRTVRAAAWGVIAVVLGAAAVASWDSTPRPEFRTWLAWVFSLLTAAAIYLCFADPLGLWPIRRRGRVDLDLEIAGNCVRLNLSNRGPAAEYFGQVTGICQPPMGRPRGTQHWPISWPDDHTAEPKRILSGQTRTLALAIFDPAAVEASLGTGQNGADHWRFPSVPGPISVNYYNLIKLSDVDDQEFILTVRIMNADSGSYQDWQITLKVKGSEIICELAAIKRPRFVRKLLLRLLGATSSQVLVASVQQPINNLPLRLWLVVVSLSRAWLAPSAAQVKSGWG